MSASQLTSALVAASDELWQWPQHDETIDQLWHVFGAGPLEALLDEPAAPDLAKFVAAETLFVHDASFMERHDGTALARVYAAALRGRFTGHANAWGLLWADDDLGPAGCRFVMIGRPAIPVLLDLLGDDIVVDWYEGSEEATVGNAAGYRIKDFAVFYLSHLVNEHVAFQADTAARDAEISRFATRLGLEPRLGER